jgi:antitoxin component YwqK of YwqJK toxin-antitoxin module
MKRHFFLLLYFIPFLVTAQQSTHPDTVVTHDPNVAGLDHWVIHGYKGTLKMQGYMLNNKKEGVWREYNEGSGMVTKMEEYRNGEKNGASMTFGPGGAVIADENYVNGKLSGHRTTYSNGGRMKSTEYYIDGKLNGVRKTYYDNSKMQEEGNWKNGERDGKTTWYLQSGTPSLEYTYKEGRLEGPTVSYDDYGKKKQEGNYKNDLEDGEWKMYTDSLLDKRVIYKAGQIVKEIPVKK